MYFERYYENPHILHVGTMTPRAYYIPCQNHKSALSREPRETSSRMLLLNGEWDFAYFPSVYDIPAPLWETGVERPAMDKISVPSTWQTCGYEHHHYTNADYPFPCDPPYVPQQNPCGLYIRSFIANKSLLSMKNYLNFEGVDSCFYLWVNGRFVGYSQVSHAASEFDVTDFLREGENEIAVLVLKWCDGSYLEDQDKFRMSGIFRDVYLLSRPHRHIWDYTVCTQTDLEKDSACISVSLVFSDPAPQSVHYTLLSPTGSLEEKGECGTELKMVLYHPMLWNAEQPQLYTLILETEDEVIAEKIGIRNISWSDGILRINGQRVVLHGVNRHDSDPIKGPAVSYESILQDLEMMKRHNINALRTSHYPNSPYLVQLCDRLGIYVCAEADVECHGVMSMYGNGADCARLAADSDFEEAWMDRISLLYERDKNRPSIIIWSAGNESGFGPNIEKALHYLKTVDPTRLTHYENEHNIPEGYQADRSCLDTFSRMYSSIEAVEGFCQDENIKVPIMLCEYSHAMGNSSGDLEEYHQLTQKYPQFCGGFIWEWCDHAMYLGRSPQGRPQYRYGGDFGEFPHSGNFCMDGLVYPDRKPHTGLLEYKNVIRPVRISLVSENRFEIQNLFDFRTLGEGVTIRYELSEDGVAFAGGDLEKKIYAGVLPHERAEFTMELPKSQKRLHIRFLYEQRTSQGPVEEGNLLGFDQIELSNPISPICAVMGPLPEICEDDTGITIRSQNFCYRYSKLTGIFESLVCHNHSFICRPMEYNIWRAPTDNDRSIIQDWMFCHYDRAVSRCYDTRVEFGEHSITVISHVSISAVSMQRFLNLESHWIVDGEGVITADIKVEKNPDVPYLPRFGIRMFFPENWNGVEYCGIGPTESYPDKHRAGYYGHFSAEVKDLHEDYLKPQENGSHCGCDLLSIAGPQAGLTVRSIEREFSFNASPYTQEQLTTTPHNDELSPSGYTVLCLDYAQSGIGSGSCGPALMEKYQLNQKTFTFHIQMKPEIY